jgi:hypothetical protein
MFGHYSAQPQVVKQSLIANLANLSTKLLNHPRGIIAKRATEFRQLSNLVPSTFLGFSPHSYNLFGSSGYCSG